MWSQRLKKLLDESPNIPRRNIGVPENWLDCPIWNEPQTTISS
jgi:hypothetical protein